MKRKSFIFSITLIFLIFAFIFSGCFEEKSTSTSGNKIAKKIKAGFIYVGPIGDYGWSYAHNEGRKYVDKKFPWLETTYVESVKEGDEVRIIDRLIRQEKCDIIFTTSFGYMDGTIKAAKKYPNKIFMHCSGYKRAKNVGTYFAELYQVYYLNGLMAGALTKSNKIGYIGAHPIPEVVRHINAFALGIKKTNPKAKVYVTWLFKWYDPAQAKEAAESLIAKGVDTLAFTEDSPTIIQLGEEYTTKKKKQIYTFSHYSPMKDYGPNTVVSGQLVNWGIMYEEILMRVYAGAWDNRDYWWLLKEKACELGAKFGEPINPKFVDELKKKKVKDPILGEISVYDLVMKRLEQMSEPTVIFDPFTGPIKDQKGKIRIKAGQRASHDMLWSMDWFVDNIKGSIPKKGK